MADIEVVCERFGPDCAGSSVAQAVMAGAQRLAKMAGRLGLPVDHGVTSRMFGMFS